MENLTVKEKYIYQGEKPFFWLGDTAWLLFTKITEEEACNYLKNRRDKGFNVIQAVLVYCLPELSDINKMYVPEVAVDNREYWDKCDRIIRLADELGLYMGLLPSWGSLVKHGYINKENAKTYAEFLAERYKDYTNIIWILGGDINPEGYEDIYNTMGEVLREKNPQKLITFHPFGRRSSSEWFNNAPWLDFNMFQSGHRRYDQCNLNSWDDNKNKEFFGEDNHKYVLRDHSLSPVKPTLDGEPSYEWILQGLHDSTQPYWRAEDVRRYAYWSVFAGACGHTYGDNSVMQFYLKNSVDKGSYGSIDRWDTALHHEGSAQMGHLKGLMESVDFISGKPMDSLVIEGQGEKYERVAVFCGKDFLFAYSYADKAYTIALNNFKNPVAWWFSPTTGTYSCIGKIKNKEYRAVPPVGANRDKDIVLVVREDS